MKKIIKTLLPIVTIGTAAGIIAPITSCTKKYGPIAGIVVTAKPTKLTYAQGQYLDLTGLEVKVITQGGEKTITTDYTASIADKTRLTEKGEKEVTITLNGTSHTDSFKINVGEPIITKLEITDQPTNRVYEQNKALNLAGMKVKATSSMDVVTEDYKGYTAEPKDGTILTKWGRNTITLTADNTSTTTDVLVTTTAVKWSEATWENISDWAYCLEAGIIGDETFFCNHFLKEDGQTKYSSLSEFVGLSKTITINEKEHTVKVIDYKHDEIDDEMVEQGTKATFTFQFFNKITMKAAGAGSLRSVYNDYDIQDYTDSILRYNLDKKGDTPKDIRWESVFEKRSFFEMLPAEFENYIWPVKKQIASKKRGESTFTLRTYTDRIFLPTLTEYYQTSPIESKIYLAEGSAYAYWMNHGDNDRKISIAGTGTDNWSYWTATCPINEAGTNINAFAVRPGDGKFGTFGLYTQPQAIAPCFCI